MAAEIVQTATGAGSASPVQATWGATPTNGNLLVAVVNSNTVVTTPAGWTVRGSFVNSQGFYIYEKTAASESTTFSVTFTGANATSISLIELDASLVGSFLTIGTDTEHAGTATTRVAATITPAAAAFILAVEANHGIVSGGTLGTYSWDNGFTSVITSTLNGSSSNAAQNAVASKKVTSGPTGATTATWTSASENQWAVHAAWTSLATGTTYTKTIADTGAGVDTGLAQALNDSETVADTGSGIDSPTVVLTSAGTFNKTVSDTGTGGDTATPILTTGGTTGLRVRGVITAPGVESGAALRGVITAPGVESPATVRAVT